MDTRIIDPQGCESNHFGFLVIFNLWEPGIEVVQVFEYEIGADDYFLDGELLAHPDGSTELLRMPVVLISHEALRRFLGPGSFTPLFADDQPPAFVGGRIEPNEIQVFNWDVRQRLMRMRSPHTPVREKRRYVQWHRRFGDRLFTEEGEVQLYARAAGVHSGSSQGTLPVFCTSPLKKERIVFLGGPPLPREPAPHFGRAERNTRTPRLGD